MWVLYVPSEKLGHLDQPSADRAQSDRAPQQRHVVVEDTAWAISGVDVSVAGDIRESELCARDRAPIGRGAQGVDPVCARLPGQEISQRASGRRRGVLTGKGSQKCDPDGARIEPERVSARDTVAVRILAAKGVYGAGVVRVPPFVDPPGLVDEEVVSDVTPALGNGVVVVDGTNGVRRIGIAV